MTAATAPSWYCATGNLADGVTGLASKPSTFDPTTNSPATFFLNQVQWGPNVWNKHWEFPHGLGAIAARIPLLEQTGFAKDYQWNLNADDWDASGVSKVGDYIAAVAVKTATNRNGVNISPYNTRHVFDRLRNGPVTPSLDTVAFAALVDPGELNQGEVEKRTCDKADQALCFGYYNRPDMASTGTIGSVGCMSRITRRRRTAAVVRITGASESPVGGRFRLAPEAAHAKIGGCAPHQQVNRQGSGNSGARIRRPVPLALLTTSRSSHFRV